MEFDRKIRAWHRSGEMSMRLDDYTGVGPALATALVATVADPKAFRSGRNFSAWIALVPKQHSSGGKDRLGSISEQGDRYLRSLFVAGALAVNCGRGSGEFLPLPLTTAGAELRYLPSYSPDFNPIEQFFAKLKTLLRKAAARTIEALIAAIAEALTKVSPQECENYLANQGYRRQL